MLPYERVFIYDRTKGNVAMSDTPENKPAKNKNWNKRDMSKDYYCHYCGQKYNRWKSDAYKDKISLYCSHSCRIKALNARKNNHTIDVSPMPIRDTAIVNTEISNSVESELGHNWRLSGEYWDKVAEWYSDRQNNERKRIANKDLAYNTVASDGRTIIISGFGARISVKNDRLIITNGRTYSTEQIGEDVLYRGIHGVSTIVWLVNGGDGNITMSALKWIASQNITLRILTNNGEHLASVFPSPNSPQALGYAAQDNGRADIRLRRAQYNLQILGKDIQFARQIILRKLAAQLNCLNLHPELPNRERGFEAVNIAIEWLSLPNPTKATNTLDGIRLFEARAAQGYYKAWQGLPLLIDAKANNIYPNEWKYFGERKSALTRFMTPKQAVTPINAILNFAYGILESQIRTALNAIGADINVGILHSDKDNRDNFVYDAIEALRGDVDDLVLTFIKTHVFSVGDFNVAPSGAISIHPSLCKVLAEQIKLPQRKAGDEAKWFKSEIMKLSIDTNKNP